MKKQKVLVIMGSPRKRGNSTILAEEAAKGARRIGAEVEIVRLRDVAIGPCLACESCRRKGAKGCVQDDGMTLLYPKLRAADAIVISSPVYWFTMSAQVKLLMDRLYAFGAEKGYALEGKGIGIILTYADADPFSSGAVNALRAFQDAFAFIGAPIKGMVYGSASKVGEIRGNKTLMKDARALGKKLGA
jgi:multimeric flavodoxin WrbA